MNDCSLATVMWNFQKKYSFGRLLKRETKIDLKKQINLRVIKARKNQFKKVAL